MLNDAEDDADGHSEPKHTVVVVVLSEHYTTTKTTKQKTNFNLITALASVASIYLSGIKNGC